MLLVEVADEEPKAQRKGNDEAPLKTNGATQIAQAK